MQIMTRQQALRFERLEVWLINFSSFSVQEHFVYEYERWQAVIGWGSTSAHLLPGVDPGE